MGTAAPFAPRRLVLYGGTFDPVHNGHLVGARDVVEQLALDAVLFIPAARSPHKLDRAAAPAEHRLAMLEAAIAGEPRFSVSRCEINRAGPSYAVTTVEVVHAEHPGAELFFLIGADQLPKLATWARFADLARMVTFIVLDRERLQPEPGDGASSIPGARLLRLPAPRRLDISSTEIRTRLQKGLSVEYLVPDPVAAYLARVPLYRTA